MLLIVVGSYSKWPEVVSQNSTTSEATVNALKTIFSRGGIPHTLVSDNGPQFKSQEFKDSWTGWECWFSKSEIIQGRRHDMGSRLPWER